MQEKAQWWGIKWERVRSDLQKVIHFIRCLKWRLATSLNRHLCKKLGYTAAELNWRLSSYGCLTLGPESALQSLTLPIGKMCTEFLGSLWLLYRLWIANSVVQACQWDCMLAKSAGLGSFLPPSPLMCCLGSCMYQPVITALLYLSCCVYNMIPWCGSKFSSREI